MSELIKLYYFASNFPGPKAQHVQMAKMVDSFIDNSIKVDFLLRKYKDSFTNDLNSFYRLNNYFRYEQLGSSNFLPIKYDPIFKSNLSKKLSEIKGSNSSNNSAVYTKFDKETSSLLENILKFKQKKGTDSFPKIIAEIHHGLNRKEEKILKLLDGIVVITPALKDEMLKHGIDASKVFIAESGVDLKVYEENYDTNRLSIREELQIPLEKNLVVYTGNLYEDRGVETLVRSAHKLDEEYLVLIVGGLENDIKRISSLINEENLDKKVVLLGSKPSNVIHLYQMAADILVMPYSKKWSIQDWSSPMKLFEYMASKRPIISSDFSTIRNIIDDESCFFVPPDDPRAMAGGIEHCINNKDYSERISLKAYQTVLDYSWNKRAEKIIDFINRLQ